jgi:hypothetical protein
LHRPGRLAIQQLAQAKFLGGATEQLFQRAGQKPLAGPVHELQPLRFVEGEHRHLDLSHHRAHQGRGLERAESLVAQGLAQGVDFPHQFTQHVVTPRTPGADREILFTQSRQEVRGRLERTNDSFAHHLGQPPPNREHGRDQHPAAGV